ncbi:hypothetical protein HPB51_013105 [Rhipicephalus microplus]|uniref:Uncharacterized protein n=1 Tax=Rhipicephalus microplus TaxID=6941 RepID=A0A9J6F360_RHIMP|nr:hypothetical protein HPB51_013105 [Rhipicephalus microplus]
MRVQLQMLQSQQAQRCLQVLPEEQSPPLGRRPEKPLLLETSLPGHHQGVATITLGAAHAQLRRLRNCSSSLLKEATVTCITPHHSKASSVPASPWPVQYISILCLFSSVFNY